MCKAKVLVVEDDPAISNLIRTTLEIQNYAYHTAESGAVALAEAASYSPDVVILDLGLPDMDGVEIIRKIRSFSRVPIIVVSARTEDRDKVQALDAGADDYLTKPFSIDEFVQRMRGTLGKNGAQDAAAGQDFYINGGLKIDYAASRAFVDDCAVDLAPTEYKLLCLLARNTGRVLTHNYILREIWGRVATADIASLRVFMATLRKKVERDTAEPNYIQTHIGMGYRMIQH